MTTKGIRGRPKRVCIECGSTETYINPKGHALWRGVKNGRIVCEGCRSKSYSDYQLLFKSKRILLKIKPRIGVCNLCRAVVPFDCKRTNSHHIIYYEENPMEGTIEACPRCHRLEHTYP